MAMVDEKGRPIVAVTGIGVVTALGVGKADNWARLANGTSGVRNITRFETAGLRTTIAATSNAAIDGSDSNAGLSERLAELAAAEAIEEAAFARRDDFPGPLMRGVAPVGVEWCHRVALAKACGQEVERTYDSLRAAAATGRFRAI